MVFVHRPFDELGRLGLRPETEAAARSRSMESTGLLVVDQVVPGGPADGSLEPGDVLIAIDLSRVRRAWTRDLSGRCFGLDSLVKDG